MGKPLTEDMSIMDWFFEAEPIGTLLRWPVLPDKLCEAIRTIHLESKRDPADPAKIAEGWRAFSGAVGPYLTGQILASDEWRCFVPAVEGKGGDWCNMWAGDTHKVVARVVYDGSTATHVKFDIE